MERVTMINNLFACMLLAASLNATPDTLEGRYTLDRDAGDDPAEVVAEATRDVGRIKRGRMRSRLREVVTPSETMEIQRDGDAYVFFNEEGRPFHIVPDNQERELETPQGEMALVTAELQEDNLVIRIQTERGERVQTIESVENGLRVVTTFSADQLPEPLRAEFFYKRDGS
jgi:hypothetical protein